MAAAMTIDSPITEAVRERYAAIAADLLAERTPSGCCDSDCCGGAGDTGCLLSTSRCV